MQIEGLATQVTQFFRALETLRAMNAEQVGLTSTEYRALARVVEVGQKTPKKLATSMGMSTGAITAVTDHLVLRGLLERVPNPTDRRSIMLQPTVEGRGTIDNLWSQFRELLTTAVDNSTDEEVDEFRDFLGRLTEKLTP